MYTCQMSLHLAPREGRFKALREEGGIFTRAPSSSAAAFSLLALPTSCLALRFALPPAPSAALPSVFSQRPFAGSPPVSHLSAAAETCRALPDVSAQRKKPVCSASVPGSACGTCRQLPELPSSTSLCPVKGEINNWRERYIPERD